MSRRSTIALLIAIAVVAGVGYGLYSVSSASAPEGAIEVAGDVRAIENVVRAPVIAYPTPDFAVGLPATSTAPPVKRRQAAATVSSRQPSVSGYLETVLVAQGEHVSKGQPLARVGARMLELGVRQAEAARDRAGANVRVIDANLDKLADNRATLVRSRAQLTAARRDLIASRLRLLGSRASLETTIVALRRQRASLESSITALEQLIGSPGGPPPHDPPYPVILQQLRAALAALDQGIAGARGGLAQMNGGLAKMRTGLAQMDSGLAKIASGIEQIDTARDRLRDARELAVISRDAADLGVMLAQAALRQATIVSPVDGTVTYARTAGTAVMVGAPIVRVRPDGATQVVTYLTPDQLSRVRVGTGATVDFDSNEAGALDARVVYIGDRAVVPPTGFPTSIVHMTRAVRVTIQLDDGREAPPGTPVDVTIRAPR